MFKNVNLQYASNFHWFSFYELFSNTETIMQNHWFIQSKVLYKIECSIAFLHPRSIVKHLLTKTSLQRPCSNAILTTDSIMVFHEIIIQATKFQPEAQQGKAVGEGKAAIANHLHDHVDHVSIRQQLQQLAGETVVPYNVVGCCEVDKHSSSLLLSWKAILDVLCQQGDLVYSQLPVSKTCQHKRIWVTRGV